jgi:hypothetical protein
MQLLAGARLVGLELRRRQRLGGGVGLCGRSGPPRRAVWVDRRRLTRGIRGQVVGRALRALARAREEQDRRARQGEQVLAERALEQPRHDQRARP